MHESGNITEVTSIYLGSQNVEESSLQDEAARTALAKCDWILWPLRVSDRFVAKVQHVLMQRG